MSFTSITLDYFKGGLLTTILQYLKKKEVNSVEVILKNEDPVCFETKIVIPNEDLDSLEEIMKEYIQSEWGYFCISAESINTSWEKFTYGVEANSTQKDFFDSFKQFQEE